MDDAACHAGDWPPPRREDPAHDRQSTERESREGSRGGGERGIAMASGTSDERRPLTITTEPISTHGSSIAVEGELDIDGIDDLRDAIVSQISRGHSHLVFDLSGTEFLDCAAIGQLIVSIAPLREDPRAAVVLLGPRGRVRRL